MADANDADVLFRIAGDVAHIIDALNKVGSQFEALAKRTEPAIARTNASLDGLFTKITGGAAIGTFLGNKLTSVFDSIYDTVIHSATALPHLIEQVGETADHFWVMSKQTGVAEEALSQMDYVATQTGTSLEAMTSNIFQMSRRLGQSTPEMRDAIKKLGLDVKTLRDEKPEESFIKLIDGLNGLTNTAARTQAGWAIFGRQFRSVQQLMGQDIRGFMKTADEMGLTISKALAEAGNQFTDAQDTFGRVFEGFNRQLGAAFLPAVTDALNGAAAVMLDFFKNLHLDTPAISALADEASDAFVKAFRAVMDAAAPLARILTDLLLVAVKTLAPVFSELADVVGHLAPVLVKVADAVGQLSPRLIALAGTITLLLGYFGGLSAAAGIVRGALATMIPSLTALFASTAVAAEEIVVLNSGMTLTVAAAPAAAGAFATIGAAIRSMLGPITLVIGGIAALVLAYKAGLLEMSQDAKDAQALAEEKAGFVSVGDETGTVQMLTKEEIAARQAARAQRDLQAARTKAHDQGVEELKSLSDSYDKMLKRGAAAGKGPNEFEVEELVVKLKMLRNSGVDVGDTFKELIRAWDENIKKQGEVKDSTDATRHSLELLRDLQASAAKTRVEIAERGLAATIHAFDIDTALERQKFKDTNDHERNSAALLEAFDEDRRLKRRKLVTDAERSLNDELESLDAATEATRLQITERGLSEQLAAITKNVEEQIRVKQKNVAKEDQAKFDEVAQAMRDKAQADRDKLIEDAHRAAADKERELTFDRIDTEIRLTEVGQDREVDLIMNATNRKLAARKAELGSSKEATDLYLKEEQIAYEDEANRVSQIMGDEARTTSEEVLQIQSKQREAIISMTESGIEEQIRLKDEQFKEERRRQIANGKAQTSAGREAMAASLTLHNQEIAAMRAADLQYWESLKKNAAARGFLERQELQLRRDNDKKILAEMRANHDKYSKQEIEEFRRRVADEDAALNDQLQTTKRSLEALATVFGALSQVGSGAFAAIAGAASQVASAMDGIAEALHGLRSTGFNLSDLSALAAGWVGVAVTIYNVVVKLKNMREEQVKANHAQDVANRLGLDFAYTQKLVTSFSVQLNKQLADESENLSTLVDLMYAGVLAGKGYTQSVSPFFTYLKETFGEQNQVAIQQIIAEALHLPDIIKDIGDASDLSAHQIDTINNHLEVLFQLVSDPNKNNLPALADAIHKASIALHDTLVLLAQAPLDQRQTAFLYAQVEKLITLAKEGGPQAAASVKTINDTLAALGQKAVDSGGLVDSFFLGMVAKAKAAGIELKGLDGFFDKMNTKLASGLKAGVGKLDVTAQVDDALKSLSNRQRQMLADAYEAAKKADSTFNLTFEEFTANFYRTVKANDKRLENSFFGGDNAKLDHASEQWQASFDRLSRIALASFNDLIAQGKSPVEAVSAIGESIDMLINRQATLGLTSNAAFGQLQRWRTLVTTNQALVDSVSGLNDVMVALANTGGLDADTFRDLQAEGVASFKQLTDAGFTQQEAESQLAPILANIIKLHNERGYAIDEETQKLIDQAREDGALKDQQLSTNDILMQGLGKLIEVLGGELPDAWKTMADSAKENADKAKKNAEELTVAVGGVDKKLNDTDWSGWADDAVQAAKDVKGAVDAVSFGASPGGIKEIPMQLDQATLAAQDFASETIAQMLAAKRAIDKASGGTFLATGGPPPPLVASGGAGTAGDLAITIAVNDRTSGGVDAVVENATLPAIVKILKRGRFVTDMKEALR